MYRPDDDGNRGGLWTLGVLTLITLGVVLSLSSCAAGPQKAGLDGLAAPDKLPAFEYREKLKLIYETNWLATVFICGVAASIFMIVQSVKAGWGVLAASAGGLVFMRLDQTLTEQTWPYLAMGVILLIGFGWYAYNTFIRKRAFKEVVAGGENFKVLGFRQGKYSERKYAAPQVLFEEAQGIKQSPSTTKLVKKEREKLNSGA